MVASETRDMTEEEEKLLNQIGDILGIERWWMIDDKLNDLLYFESRLPIDSDHIQTRLYTHDRHLCCMERIPMKEPYPHNKVLTTFNKSISDPDFFTKLREFKNGQR